MPTDWQIRSFSYEKGFGTLSHASGDEVLFNIDVWNLGSWKPSRKEARSDGPGSALLPRVGEPVAVTWKRSINGKTVPSSVQPTSRVSIGKEHGLAAWLKAIQRHTGHFRDLKPASLLKVLAKVDEDLPDAWGDGEPRAGAEYGSLLQSIALLREHAPGWFAEHASWVYEDDWRWNREQAVAVLPAMLGLSSAPAVASESESLDEYAARCNVQAEMEGRALRLCNVETDSDFYVLLALEPGAFAALIKDEFLVASE
jgi:hypothetical protein